MVLALLRKKGVGREENDMEGKGGGTGSLGCPQSFGVSGKRSQEKGSGLPTTPHFLLPCLGL